MASDREELEALRRLAELEARAPLAEHMEPGVAGFMAENRRRNAKLFEGEWGSGAPKLAYDVGGKVTDLTGSPAAGFATNVATQAIPALLSGYRTAPAPEAAARSLTEAPARRLMQSAVKPTLADRSSGAARRALATMLEQNISPTASGMDKAARAASSLDDVAERAVSASPASVSVNAVGQRLQEPATQAMTQVNPQQDIEAIKSVWENFKNAPLVQGAARGANAAQAGAAPAGEASIPVQLAHALKKGTYRSLGGKAYGEVGSVSTEAQKALARGLREEVAAAVPEAADSLKQEAALRNVIDVARNRVLQDANKNPMGLAALRIGDNPLSALSFLADRSAYVKGLLARLLYQGGQPSALAPAGVAGSEVFANRPEQ